MADRIWTAAARRRLIEAAPWTKGTAVSDLKAPFWLAWIGLFSQFVVMALGWGWIVQHGGFHAPLWAKLVFLIGLLSQLIALCGNMISIRKHLTRASTKFFPSRA